LIEGDGKGMRVSRFLFPRDYRSFTGKRWTNITLRAAHLIGIAGLVGGFLYQSPKVVADGCFGLMPYLVLSVVSGFAIICLDIWTHGIWLIQLRGLAIFIKLILLLCIPFFKGYEAHVLMIVIVISGIIAHAPGDVRYFSVFHGRRIEDLSLQYDEQDKEGSTEDS
jgi:predicted Co/Zn/Cd cation transporter (cation efflux family)